MEQTRKCLFIGSALIAIYCFPVQAQTVISVSDIVSWDTVLYQGIDNQPDPSIMPGDTGLQSWDFSSLIKQGFDSALFINPGVTLEGYKFPNSNLCYVHPDGHYIYFNKSPTGLSAIGVVADVLNTGNPLTGNVSPPYYFIKLPANYDDVLAQTSYLNKTVYANDVNVPFFDSVVLKRTMVMESRIDAYGTMYTPLGTFDVLRQNIMEITTDYVKGIKYLAGVILHSSVLYDEVDTAYIYKWWTNGQDVGFPLVEMEVNKNGEVQSVNYLVSVNADISSSFSVSCTDSCDGTATVAGSLGIPPYQYVWNDPVSQTAQTATGLCSGSLTAKIIDSTGSFITIPVVISEPSELTGYMLTSEASCDTCLYCQACADGAASAISTGGTPPYTYSWSTNPPQFTRSISGLNVGTYTVTVTDANGCTTSITDSVALFKGIKVYPNPATTVLNILFNDVNEKRFIMYDLTGRLVINTLLNEKKAELDISSLSAGVYIYNIVDKQGELLIKNKLCINQTQ